MALFLVVLLVGQACVQSSPVPSPTASVALSSGTATARPTPSAAVPLGGTLRVGLSGPIGSLDPQAADANASVIGQIFEGLVARGTNGVAPALALKWLVGADGVAWTFMLREGVVFHDGSPLDAAAVAKSLGRLDDPLIAKAEASDAHTVVLTTKSPSGTFLSALATRAYAIVSPSSKLAGTGPFRVPAGGENARPLILERNDRYWRSDATGQRLPYLDRLSLAAIPDAGTRLAAIRAGNVDLIADLAISDLGAVRTDPSLQIVIRPATTVLYLGLNLSASSLDDLRVRQAIAQALNPRGLVDRFYGGAAAVASQLPPPTMLGHDDSVTEFAKNDVAAAKKLLADSGHPTLQLDLWYLQDAAGTLPDLRRIAESVAADLAPAGIAVDTKTIDPITFGVSLHDNKYPAWLGSATPETFDPDELLGAPFIPPVANGQDQPTAAGAWLNKEVAGLLRKARTEPDQSKRAELYKQVSKIIQRELPRIPLAWSSVPLAATRKVINPQSAVFADVALGR